MDFRHLRFAPARHAQSIGITARARADLRTDREDVRPQRRACRRKATPRFKSGLGGGPAAKLLRGWLLRSVSAFLRPVVHLIQALGDALGDDIERRGVSFGEH